MALSKDSRPIIEFGYKNDLPVKAATTIYQGAAVGDDAAGYARGLVAGDPFRGFAVTKADNSAGAAGDINVNLYKEGAIQLAISGLAITDVGKYVYASADDTFTLTEGSNTFIGVVIRYVSSGVGVVEFCVDDTQGVITAQAGGATTIATTGNTDFYITAPCNGVIDNVLFAGVDALAANDTNYITFGITNLGQAGAGSTAILAAATDASITTKATGGTAIAANTKRTLALSATAAAKKVVKGDRLLVRAAATGTLANTVTFATYLITFKSVQN